MLYASHYPRMTVVAAATTLAEAEVFYSNVQTVPGLVASHERPDIIAMLTDDRYSSFQVPPFVFHHADDAERDAFAARENLTIVTPKVLVDRHRDMMLADAPDPYDPDAEDTRTIAEKFNLDTDDRWDKRTDEQKTQDEHYRKLAEEAKRAGNLSGDSFAPKKDPRVQVTDIRSTVNKDGSVTINDVLAVKGLHDDNGILRADETEDEPTFHIELEQKPVNPSAAIYAASLGVPAELFAETDPDKEYYLVRVEGPDANPLDLSAALPIVSVNYHAITSSAVTARGRAFLLNTDERGLNRIVSYLRNHLRFQTSVVSVMGDGRMVDKVDFSEETAREINPGGPIAIYYRADIPAPAQPLLTMDDVVAAVPGLDPEKMKASGFEADGTYWVAVLRLITAEAIASSVPGGEAYGVNDNGERLVPKGASVVDTHAPPDVLVRPWTTRSDEFYALSADEQAEILKAVEAKEFIITGSDVRDVGVVFYAAPRAYFDDKGEFWPESLPIGHLLGSHIREVSPGVYKCTSQDWNRVSLDLNKKGFREDLFFQIYINNL